jgi:hypothetical protein
MGERNTASIPGNGVSLASNYAGSQNCCLTGSLPFLFLHIVLRFHARANPEPNRVGREATFYIRPLTSSLSLAVHLLVLHACLVWGGYSLPRNSQVSGTSISRLTDLSLVSLASNLEGKRNKGCCRFSQLHGIPRLELRWQAEQGCVGNFHFPFVLSQIKFHAQANPEFNRAGREATFHSRPLTSFLFVPARVLVRQANVAHDGCRLPRI